MDKYSEYFNNVVWARNMVEIRQVASITRAPLFKDEAVTEGLVCSIISIKDFPYAGYLPRPQKQVRIGSESNRVQHFAVKENDVLLTIVGTIGKVTIVPDTKQELWIPATNMILIRFHDSPRKNAIALYVYLKSPVGQSGIQNLIHGSSIPIITKGQVATMKIPAPSPETWNGTEAVWNEEERLHREAQRLLEEAQAVFSVYNEGAPERDSYSISS